MPTKVLFLVTGHGELNGNLKINISKELDSNYAHQLRANKVALLQFVSTNYPGAKIKENSLTVNIKPIINETTVKESITRKSSVNKYDDEPKRTKEKVSGKKDSSLTSVLTGMAVGAVLNAINDKSSKRKDDENEIDERIEDAERKSADKKIRNTIYSEISSVLDFDFINSLSDIQDNMDKLLFALVSLNSLKYSESSKIYQSRLAQKYKIGLIRLKAIDNSEKLYSYYRRRYWQINIKRIFFRLFNSID